MNRRGFLSALAAAVVGPLSLDPEKLLWVPGKKLISIPPALSMSVDDYIHKVMREAAIIFAQHLDESLLLTNSVAQDLVRRSIH